MSDSDVKSGGRKATVILLNGDVTWLDLRFSDLVLFLDHNGCETSTPRRVTENVSDVVVSKHQRRAVVATSRVISKHIHLSSAGLPITAQ